MEFRSVFSILHAFPSIKNNISLNSFTHTLITINEIVRNANFKGANLFGASFFDATLNGSNFQGADLTQVRFLSFI